MKKIILFVLFWVLCFGLVGCNKDLITHRTVEKMNETSKEDYYQVEFTNLDGRTVVKVKKDRNDGTFKCIASLTNGALSVKYVNSSKQNTVLFTLNKNESIDETYGYITSNENGYIVIETSEIATGSIYISWN